MSATTAITTGAMRSASAHIRPMPLRAMVALNTARGATIASDGVECNAVARKAWDMALRNVAAVMTQYAQSTIPIAAHGQAPSTSRDWANRLFCGSRAPIAAIAHIIGTASATPITPAIQTLW